MIIKIVNLGDKSNVDFVLFDNIAKLEVEKKRKKQDNYDEQFLFLRKKETKDYICLYCKDRDDKYFNIAFDSSAHICNDKGELLRMIHVSE